MKYFDTLLRGHHKIILSLLPDNIIKPLLFLLLLAGTMVFYGLNLKIAISLNIIAYIGGLLITYGIFKSVVPLKEIKAIATTSHWDAPLKTLFLFSIINVIRSQIDIVMLGYIKFNDPSQVGIYKSADLVATYVLFFLTLMNLITAPSISRLYAMNEKEKLQRLVTKTIRGVLALTVPFVAVFIIFSHWIMLYFGPNFLKGQSALIILCIAQLINVCFGQVGNVSLMTGNQKYNSIFAAVAIVINVIVNLILTPAMGINGTAIATAVAIIFWNVSMFYMVKKNTGIKTWVFG